MTASEFNFDGIVGPTHNFAGLSYGNVASATNHGLPSSPQKAALQGLAKMRFVHNLGVGQAVLPPLPRPRLSLLRRLGFSGNTNQLIDSAFRTDPILLAACYSASSMWTANAATVSPSSDTADHRLHLTPANLSTLLHRAIEAEQTYPILKTIFADPNHFKVHPPLPANRIFSDEGAANHTRLASEHQHQGLELFVYGRAALHQNEPAPSKYPARQTLEACQTIARLHQLEPQRTCFLQQRPDVIDAGVFHNDVISVGSCHVLLTHQSAFVNQVEAIVQLQEQFFALADRELVVVEICEQELSVSDAVRSYLFNSQLLKTPNGKFVLVCPTECQATPAAAKVLESIIQDCNNPIESVEFLNLRESMSNGGGPACLRLRVVMTEGEQAAIHPHVLWNAALDQRLTDWITKHYRTTLTPADLRDPKLVTETCDAMSALANILNLPPQLLMDSEWIGF